MARTLRITSTGAGALALDEFNPINSGEMVRIYSNADADGDSFQAFAGGTLFANIQTGVEAVTGRGPIIPDDLVAEWRNRTNAPVNLSITVVGDNLDILLWKDV